MTKNKIIHLLENKWVLHPYLLCIFFILFSLQESGGDASAIDIIISLLILFVSTILLQTLISRFILKDWFKSSYLITFCLFFSLFFVSIISTFQEIWFLSWVQFRHVLVFFILTFGLLFWYFKKEKITNRLNLYLTVLFLIFIIQPTFQIFSNRIEENNQRILLNAKITNKKDLPDIYLILLDGYAKHENLKKYWGFDNQDFVSKLDSMGFYHAKKSRSNYFWTTQVVCSMLNLDYLSPKLLSNNTKQHHKIRDNLTVNILRENGYRIVNHSIFNFGNELNPTAQPILQHILDFKETLFYKTIFGVFTSYWKGHSDVMTQGFNREREGMIYPKILNEITEDTNSNPKFVYYHSTLCHYPYYLDDSGNESEVVNKRNPTVAEVQNWVTKLNENKELANKTAMDTNTYCLRNKMIDKKWNEDYINHIKVVNNRSLSLINRIFAVKKKTVIIIMSDHGFRFLSPNKISNIIAESHENITHIYFPDRNYQMLNDSISPVNLMRLTIGSAFGREFVKLNLK